MNSNESNVFKVIESADQKYQAKVGKPNDEEVNIFFNFNIFAYMGFVEVIEKLPYLQANNISDYENGTSGMGVKLTANNSLSKFIEDLPELIYLYVENVNPTQVIRKGTKDEQSN